MKKRKTLVVWAAVYEDSAGLDWMVRPTRKQAVEMVRRWRTYGHGSGRVVRLVEQPRRKTP